MHVEKKYPINNIAISKICVTVPGGHGWELLN